MLEQMRTAKLFQLEVQSTVALVPALVLLHRPPMEILTPQLTPVPLALAANCCISSTAATGSQVCCKTQPGLRGRMQNCYVRSSGGSKSKLMQVRDMIQRIVQKGVFVYVCLDKRTRRN